MIYYRLNEPTTELIGIKTDPCKCDIHIKYFGSIRKAAGKCDESIAVAPDTTVFQTLQKLAVLNGDIFCSEIFGENGIALRNDLMVTLNEAIMKHADAADTTLESGDVIALFPIFPGGG